MHYYFEVDLGGHVANQDNTGLTRHILQWRSRASKRSTGNPKNMNGQHKK